MSKTIKVRVKKEYINSKKFYTLPETLQELLYRNMFVYEALSDDFQSLSPLEENRSPILTATYFKLENMPFSEHVRCKIEESRFYKGYYSTKYFEEVKNETSTTKSTFNNYDKVAAYLLKDANSNLDAFDEQELGLNESDLYEIEDLAQDRWNEIRNAEELTFSFTLTRYEWEKLSASDPEFNKRIQEKLSNRGNH